MKPGDLIAAKYRLERVIGTGAMGEVWAAVNESTRRPVALKLIPNPNAELRTRMLREALAAGSLKHRNVVDVYDVGETVRGDPFLVMELLSGETLADRLRRVRRLPPAEAAEIAGAIARGLRAAHAKGIIHRDLKPANVFLHREADAEGEVVKVLDFGVCKQLEDPTGTLPGGLVGSPAYMSPEQARAEANIDARSDLWSLGAVLFEMLAGHRPFSNRSPYAVIAEVLAAPIPSIAALVPEVSPALARVVERCLTRDVAARVASADELIRLLRPFPEESASSPGNQAPARSLVEELAGTLPPELPRSSELPTIPRAHPELADSAPKRSIPRTLVMSESAAAAIRLGVAETATGTTPPLVQSPATRSVARRSPFPIVALMLSGVALTTLVVLGAALRRPPPPAPSAAAAAETSVATPDLATKAPPAAIAQPASPPAVMPSAAPPATDAAPAATATVSAVAPPAIASATQEPAAVKAPAAPSNTAPASVNKARTKKKYSRD
jgi:serine/threonine-protein kinase